MLQELLYKWFHPKAIAGVAVQLGAVSGEYLFDWAVLKQHKGKATIQDKGEVTGDLSALVKSLPQPVSLSLSLIGKGVLVRKISVAKAGQADVMAQELLPGAKADDYYFDTVSASLGQVLVAMVRRTTVDTLLAQAKTQGVEILQLRLGPMAAVDIAHIIDFATDERLVEIPGYSIKFNHDNVPESIERTEENISRTYQIAGETVTAHQTLPFATALGFWLSPAEQLLEADATGDGYGEYLHKKVFQVGLKIVLGGFFMALLLNFVLFNQQFNLNSELKQLSGNKQEQLQRFETLKKKHDQSFAFLASEGWLRPAKTSFYADAIAATIPREVVLTQMTVYPDTVGKKTNQTRSRYNTQTITLNGQVGNSLILQEWTALLRERDWVKTVTVKNYSQENPNAQGVFDMVLEIKP